MYIICYRDTITDVTHFEECMEYDTYAFSKDHPNAEIKYIFDSRDDIPHKETRQATDFYDHCAIYGFQISDYERKVTHENGSEMILIGFLPQNHKYKCLLQNIRTGRQVKATPRYVQTHWTMTV